MPVDRRFVHTIDQDRSLKDWVSKRGMAKGATVKDRVSKGRKISLGEIHRRTGISVAHLSKVFSGKRTPSLAMAARIATAKRISLDDLYMELYEVQQALRGEGPRIGTGGKRREDFKDPILAEAEDGGEDE